MVCPARQNAHFPHQIIESKVTPSPARTLVTSEPTAATWSATVDAGDLRAAANEMHRCATVHVEASARGIRLRVAERDDLHCRLVAEPFPDYRAMLANLPEPTTRVTVAKYALLRALEDSTGEHITLSVTDGAIVSRQRSTSHS